MKPLLLALLVAVLAPTALAQVLPTDILISKFGAAASIDHYRADGTLVQRITGAGQDWLGASRTPTGEIVTTRRGPGGAPPYGVNVLDPATGLQVRTFDLTAGYLGDIDVFSDGTLAVVAQTGSIQLYTLTGTFLGPLAPASMSHPFGCYIDENDHLWVSDITSLKIYQMDRVGAVLNEFSVPFQPGDLIRAPDDTLWIMGLDGRVYHYDHGGVGTQLGSFPTVPYSHPGIAMTPAGTLWITGNFDLHHYDQSGALLGTLLLPSLGWPAFISIGEAPCPGGTNYCTAGTTSSGCHATMGAAGSPSLSSSSPFTLSCTNVEGDKDGIFFYGITGRVASMWGIGGNTWLCVKAPIQRMSPLQNSGGAAGTCAGSLSLDWNAYVAANPSKPINQAMMIGTVVASQAWFRDPASGTGPLGAKGTALSDGVEFTVCP